MCTTISMDSNKAWHSFEKIRIEIAERRDKLSVEIKEHIEAKRAPRKFLGIWTYTPSSNSWDDWEMWAQAELYHIKTRLKNIERIQSMCLNSHSITLSKEDFGIIKSA